MATSLPSLPSVLFVDDEANLLRGLERLLRREARWRSHFALGGEAALQLLEQRSFSCVVCDLEMPVVDGAALVAVIREQHPATSVVLLTGSEPGHTAKVVDAHLVKPCSPRELTDTLARVLALPA